ncbi:50S ribosomal protein L24 [Candidatus Saccharibacteria bacterium]|nr:50S ribosomal protein L24 [Candidatus Saccharibacteria bacterium]
MKSLKVNDTVKIISGDKKGVEAKIVKIDRENGKACLEGIGVIEKKLKPTTMNPRGGKKTVHLPIDLSNLKLVKASESVKSTVKKIDKTDKKSDKKAKKGAK